MPRKKELHGAALYHSQYCNIVVLWIYKNPRLTAGKIRSNLINRFGPKAGFSEPHIQAFLKNYYPEIIKKAFETEEGGISAVAALTESNLFGEVADPLDYHQRMVLMLETRLKEAESEYIAIRERVLDKETPAADTLALSTAVNKLRDQIVKLSREIRLYKQYIDEWQRAFDFGERMGDLMYRLVEQVMDIIVPEVPDKKRKTVQGEFSVAYRQLAREFKIPAEKLAG